MHDIFISYSHADEEWKDRITVFLRCVRLRKRVGFRAWNDDDIRIGDRFEATIRRAIDEARVALLLVSPDFMASEFVYEKELGWMRERAESGLLAVSPILIRPSPLSLDPWLSSLQFHPDDTRALSTLPPHEIDEALTALTDEIDRLLVDDSDVASTEEESIDRVDTDTAPAAPTKAAWSPLGRTGVHQYLRERTGMDPLADLLIFRTKKQQTWLIATAGWLYCVLDDEKTQRRDRLVQWRQPVTALPLPIGTRPSSRYQHLGLLDIGDRQNWLYSKRLFDHPDGLVARVNELVEVARSGTTGGA